ncbi:MAG TPA: MFS transporter [Candidatus Binataceae bacterium]|nr:MFS transporter [Candidatus Binataceae bacterium]
MKQDRTSRRPSRRSPYAAIYLLFSRRFGSFWIGSLLSNLGTWMQQIAEPWLIVTLGGSAIMLGLDGFAMNAPVWVLTLLGGVLADTRDRKKVIATFQSIQMLCPALLIVLILTGTVRIWMIIALSLIVGITDALSMPAFQSIVPSIVESGQIGTAIALNSTQFNLSRVLGPAIAGVVMVRYGSVWCFGANTLSYVPLIVTVYLIGPVRKVSASLEMKTGAPWIKQILAIGSQPKLRNALLNVLVTGLFCAPLINFSPILVRNVFHSDALDFGKAVAAFGVGGLIGAVSVLAIEGMVARFKISSVAAIAFGALLVALAANRSLPVVNLLFVLCGAVMTIGNTSANSILQYTARDRVRGRTASLYMLAVRGGLSLGNLITGLSAAYLGIRAALLINGLLAILLQSLIARTSTTEDHVEPASRSVEPVQESTEREPWIRKGQR